MNPVVLQIDADHPSLAGHFPGRPVVPGVVILDAVHAAAAPRAGSNFVLRHMPQVKFLQPLLPGQLAKIMLDEAVPVEAGRRLRFRVLIEDDVIATGELVFVERMPNG